MKFTLGIALAALVFTSGLAYAEPPGRQHRDDREPQQKQDRANKGDGHLSREERKDLNKDLNDISKEVYRDRQDGDRRHRPRR